MDALALSVVAPCHNEAGVLPAFVARVTAACAAMGCASYEIVLVNDGSRDRTWETIQTLAAGDPHLVGVDLSRNHGHQLAASAGLALARGAGTWCADPRRR